MKTLIIAIFGYGLFEIIMNYWKIILFVICFIIGIWLFTENNDKKNNNTTTDNVPNNNSMSINNITKLKEQNLSSEELLQLAKQAYQNKNYQSEDFKTGIKWLRMSVNKGNTNAMVLLGKLYAEGRIDGLPNYQEAMNLYKKASDLGNMEAHKELDIIYNKLNRSM